MSVHEISAWQCDVREPFQSVGLVCSCGGAVAGIEGVIATCSGCGTAYIVSVMQLRRASSGGATGDTPADSGGTA